jgi:asparagine synthase (glutamine-hydrolysing)
MTAGARLGAGRTAFDVARLNEVGIAAALRGSFSKMMLRGLPHRWPSQTAFFSQVAQEHLKVAPSHPWLAPPLDELPGKIMHVAWIAAIQNHLEGFGREWMYPLRAPLLSQPIVEHCLTIPSWFWCSEGRDRFLAREAFVDMLPPAVLNRRSKGTPTGFVMQILDENRGPIKELLLEGQLAKESIIDTARVEAFFADPDPRDVAPYMEIMGLVDAEAWLQAWAQPSPYLKANPRQLAGVRGASAHS